MVVAVAVCNPHCPDAKPKGTSKKKHLLVLEHSGVLVILSQAPLIFQRKLNEPQKSIAHGTGS